MQGQPVLRPGQKHLHAEEPNDGADERDHQRFYVTESPALQEQNQQHVEAGDEHAVEKWNVEEQLERDGRTDDFSEIACGDGDLGHHPKRETRPRAVALAAKLGQVPLRGHAQLERKAL